MMDIFSSIHVAVTVKSTILERFYNVVDHVTHAYEMAVYNLISNATSSRFGRCFLYSYAT